MPTTKAKIHSYESMATLDGDGVRFAVFFCGCPLRCDFCHNPDTWNSDGVEISPEDLAKKIIRYKPYFGSRGGATFSGGEPLLQAQFVSDTEKLLNENGINCCIDTSGAVELSVDVINAVERAELIILDLKFWNEETYNMHTGGDISKVLLFGDLCERLKKRVWLRSVIIPGINDTICDIDKYVAIAKRWKNIEKYELLGFHTLGFSKYEKLNLQNPLIDILPLDNEKLQCLQNYLSESCQNCKANSL